MDAAVFSNTNSIGALIYDHEGRVEATINKSNPIPLGPLEAEAKAWRKAYFLHGMWVLEM